MHTLCTHCHHPLSLTAEELRKSRGLLICSNCQASFDALEHLSDQPLATPPKPRKQPHPAEDSPARGDLGKSLWTTGVIAGIGLLLGQIVYFKGYQFTQTPELRPWLAQACEALDCKLPNYNDVSALLVIQSQLQSADPDSYHFSALVNNQAEFQQGYPDVKLTLTNFSGQTFAERIFTANDYRPASNALAADESAEIAFNIAAPQQKVGGYQFTLLAP